MITVTLAFLATLCVAIICLWITVPKWRSRIDELTSLLTCLSSIATLTVFLQFYQTWKLAAEASDAHNKEELAKFNSRMSALASEIVNNIEICNLFNSEKDRYLSGSTVPGIRFEFGVAQDMIRSGEITHHKLRAELVSLITQMRSENAVIQENMTMMITRGIAAPAQQPEIQQRIIRVMTQFMGHVEHIRTQLAGTHGYLEEFWKSPQSFQTEDYLHNKLIPDSLIR